jgi:probable HAF family extracellular repeat protein
MNRFACFIAPLLLSMASPAFAAVQYTVVELGTLGGQNTNARAINAAGQVVGGSERVTGTAELHAFLYSDGVMKDLDTIGESSEGWDINDAGVVVGQMLVPTGGTHAFLTHGAGMTDLTPAGWNTYAAAINSSGEIVGTVEQGGRSAEQPAIYSNGNWTTLGTLGGNWGFASAVNNNGQIAVSVETGAHNLDAFLYQNGSMIDLGTLGGTQSWTYGINDAGAVVGWSSGAGDAFEHAFLYEKGRMQDLGVLDAGSNSAAYAINNEGIVVGESNNRATIWTNGKPFDLNGMVPSTFDARLIEARGINDSGEIICNGTDNGYERAFLLIPRNPPALGLRGGVRRLNARLHVTIRGTITNVPVKYVTFHVGRSRPVPGTPSHPGRASGKHLRYAHGTSSWSLSVALKPGKNYVTIIAHGFYANSRPVTVEVIQK